ncbi:MAG: acetolactate synthase-1/3 small subunit [Candidatus Azotimanducaceae bacterium]|jgi:acetolactate synthase-1/3 small subunit
MTIDNKEIVTTDKSPTIVHSSSQHTLSVYVSNTPGVLARIAQTFARRNYNIESLVVSPGMDGRFSRMSIGLSGDEGMLDQIIMQVNKLIDVVNCADHSFETSVVKEFAMIKILCDIDNRSEAMQIAEHFGCKTLDLTQTSMIFSIAGNSKKIDAFVAMISNFKVVEMVRTGKVVMVRGDSRT